MRRFICWLFGHRLYDDYMDGQPSFSTRMKICKRCHQVTK